MPWIRPNPNYHDVNVRQQEQDPDSILNYYRALIRLRKSSEALVYGKYEGWLEEHPEIFMYSRRYGGEEYFIVLNFYGNAPELRMPAPWRDRKLVVVLSNYEAAGRCSGRFALQPYEAIVYRVTLGEKAIT